MSLCVHLLTFLSASVWISVCLPIHLSVCRSMMWLSLSVYPLAGSMRIVGPSQALQPAGPASTPPEPQYYYIEPCETFIRGAKCQHSPHPLQRYEGYRGRCFIQSSHGVDSLRATATARWRHDPSIQPPSLAATLDQTRHALRIVDRCRSLRIEIMD